MLDETRKILIALNKIALGNVKGCGVCHTIAADIQGILLREAQAEKEQEKQEDEEFENRHSWMDDGQPCPECGQDYGGTL